MKNTIAVVVASGLAATASADVVGGVSGVSYAGQVTLGDVSNPIAGGAAPVTRYSNVEFDNFSGSGFAHGADTAWDDLNLVSGGNIIDSFDFTVANLGDATLSAVDVVVSFSDDPAGDGPDAGDNRLDLDFGTLDLVDLLGGGGLGSLSSVILNTGDIGPGFELPEDPAGFTWMGVTFTNAVGVDNADVGQAHYDPPTIGSSEDQFFLDDFGLASLQGDTVANFGNSLSTVPAPGALALLGLGGLTAARRRR